LRCCCRAIPPRTLAVAETIRLKVAQWSAGPMVTTVSIGIASATPAPGMD